MKYFLLFLLVISAVSLTGCTGEPTDLADDYSESHGQGDNVQE